MFVPRHPVVENQFCTYGAQTGTGSAGVGGVICYAGAALYLSNSAANQEAIVYRYDRVSTEPTNADERVPFGLSMQKVKTDYHQVHPTMYFMPGDLGSSDVIAAPTYDGAGNITGTAEAPVGVAHLGIWDTVHYTAEFTGTAGTNAVVSAAIAPGALMYVAANAGARLTTSNSAAGSDTYDGKRLPHVTTVVARVCKGVSAAKATANINNVTLYPIRVKLMV